MVAKRIANGTPDPRLLAFVDELAALYAELWHEGKLDEMVKAPDDPTEDE